MIQRNIIWRAQPNGIAYNLRIMESMDGLDYWYAEYRQAREIVIRTGLYDH